MLNDIKWRLRDVLKLHKEKKIRVLQDLAREIGFYQLSLEAGLQQHHFQNVREFIVSMGISNLDIKGNIVTITLARPGLLIGRRGCNIDGLKKHLSNKYKKKITIRLKEEMVLQCLLPCHPSDFDNDY